MTSRLAAIVVLVSCAMAQPAAAQQRIAFTGGVGVMTYAVPEAQAAEFGRVVQRLLDVLSTAGTPEQPRTTLPLRLLEGSAEGGFRLFVLIAEPTVPGTDYSLDAIIRDRIPAPEADELVRALQAARGGGYSYVMDLRERRSVTVDSALRTRLETQLGPLSPQSGATNDRERRASLDAFRRGTWIVDSVRFEVIDRGPTRWRIRWTCDIRNPSPVEPFSGSVTVAFNASDGRQVAAGARSAVRLEALEQQALTGEVDVDAATGQRITAAVALVDAPFSSATVP